MGAKIRKGPSSFKSGFSDRLLGGWERSCFSGERRLTSSGHCTAALPTKKKRGRERGKSASVSKGIEELSPQRANHVETNESEKWAGPVKANSLTPN